MSKKLFISIYIISIIVFLLIGFGIGANLGKMKYQTKISQTQSEAQKEINWLKSQLERFYPPLPEEIYNVSGTVTEKGDDFLKMETQIRVSQFPLPEGKEIEKQNIKVNLTDETKIFKIEMITPPPPLPQNSVKEKILSLGDIKVGDGVIVTSNADIKGKTEILASQIHVARQEKWGSTPFYPFRFRFKGQDFPVEFLPASINSEFLESLDRAEKDYKTGRVKKIKSLKKLRR